MNLINENAVFYITVKHVRTYNSRSNVQMFVLPTETDKTINKRNHKW